jgi:hypothetical protein
MAVYIEKKEKLNLFLSDSDNEVKITVNCYYGAMAAVSFYQDGLKTVRCGETKVIGKASELKGKSVEFNGKANNPGGNNVKVEHKIHEVSENSIIYIFPDDYTGSPDYDPNDENPNYKFFVNME